MAKRIGLGLGRGLDALMGTGNEEEIAAIVNDVPVAVSKEPKSSGTSANRSPNIPDGIEIDEDGNLWLNPDRLVPNPNQPRTEFDAAALEELSDSIKEHGIIQPIIVEKAESGADFYIIAGERRTRAAKLAGLKKVPIRLSKFDNIKKLEVALIENIQRADLNPIDEANAYYNLMQMGDLTQEEVAQRVGKKRPTIANALRLMKLPEDIQKSLVDGQITSGHARALLMCENMADQRVLFGKIVGSGLSVRLAEDMARDFNNGGRAVSKKTEKKVPPKDPDLSSIEQKFIEILGTKVNIKGTLSKGSICIDYYSKEDLNRLYGIIAGE